MMVSLASKANEVVDSIKDVEAAVEAASTSSGAAEALKSTAANAVAKIQAEEKTFEAVAGIVSKDASSDESVVAAIKSADNGLGELIKKAEEVITDSTAAAGVKSQAELIKESIKAVESAAIECTGCAVTTVPGLVSDAGSATTSASTVESTSFLSSLATSEPASTNLEELMKAAEEWIKKAEEVVSDTTAVADLNSDIANSAIHAAQEFLGTALLL